MVSGAAGLARKLIAEYLATVPDEQLISISRMMKSISYTVGMKKPGSGHSHNDEYGMWISFNLANQLFSGCHDHCMMCAFDGVKQRTCPLRKALAEIAIETVDEGGDCPYFGVM